MEGDGERLQYLEQLVHQQQQIHQTYQDHLVRLNRLSSTMRTDPLAHLNLLDSPVHSQQEHHTMMQTEVAVKTPEVTEIVTEVPLENPIQMEKVDTVITEVAETGTNPVKRRKRRRSRKGLDQT